MQSKKSKFKKIWKKKSYGLEKINERIFFIEILIFSPIF